MAKFKRTKWSKNLKYDVRNGCDFTLLFSAHGGKSYITHLRRKPYLLFSHLERIVSKIIVSHQQDNILFLPIMDRRTISMCVVCALHYSHMQWNMKIENLFDLNKLVLRHGWMKERMRCLFIFLLSSAY